MRNRAVAVVALCALALAQSLITAGSGYAAEPIACQREPRDAVAQMCGDPTEHMYGVFVTFSYPTPSYTAPPPYGSADFFNETQFFTDEAMTKSFGFGLDMKVTGPEPKTAFQPYWVDYTAGYELHPIGAPADGPDGRLHSFMAVPQCSGCTTWDLFYDFQHVGTTSTQPQPSSHHLMTGWALVDMFGQVGLSPTSNRIMYLNGNNQFQRFNRATTSTRSPAGDCSPGADPAFCFRFDTAMTTIPSTAGDYVVSWDVTKPNVSPGLQHPSATGPTPDHEAEAEALERRAQDFVAQRGQVVPR